MKIPLDLMGKIIKNKYLNKYTTNIIGKPNPIRFGIISTAWFATKMIKAINACPFSIPVAVASRDLVKAENWSSKFNFPLKSFGNYEDLLNNPDINAVYIPLPTTLKGEWGK